MGKWGEIQSFQRTKVLPMFNSQYSIVNSNMDTKVSVILVGGGYSTRMGGDVRKPYLSIKDKPVFLYAVETYSSISSIDQIILVVNALDLEMVNAQWGECLKEFKVSNIVKGGKRRQDSVYNGLKHVNSDSDIVLIHDSVRPFISKELITQTIHKTKEYGAAIVAVPVKDTIKESEPSGTMTVKRTVPRSNLWAAQTPQGFKSDIILKAYNDVQNADFDATDDAQIVEKAGYKVAIVQGDYNNIKITTPEDLQIAEQILKL